MRFINLGIFIFLDVLKRNTSPRFVSNCFLIDGSEELVSIMFDDRLPFVPKVLELKYWISDYLNEFDENSGNKINYILNKQENSCSKPFILKVPRNRADIQNVKTTISYGFENFIIDEYDIWVERGFQENELDILGLLQHSQMHFVFIHESPLAIWPGLKHQKPTKVDWTEELQPIKPDELYCVDFFTFDFDKILFFYDEDLPEKFSTTYYFLTIFIDGKDKYIKVSSKEYLVRVRPCEIHTIVGRRLAIFSEPLAASATFIFHDGYWSSVFIYLNAAEHMRLRPVNPLFRYDFKIILTSITQEMVDRNAGMFLYRSQTLTQKSWIKIPGISTPIEFPKMIEEKAGVVVLQRKLYDIYMDKKEFGVFPVVSQQ